MLYVLHGMLHIVVRRPILGPGFVSLFVDGSVPALVGHQIKLHPGAIGWSRSLNDLLAGG